MTDRLSLEALLAPVGVDAFVTDHHEQRHLHLHGDPTRLALLPGIPDVDELLAYGNLRGGADVLVVDHQRGGRIPAATFSHSSGLVDAAAVAHEFAAGGTLVLPDMQWRFPALAHLVREVAQRLGARSQTNMYLTPPGSQGLDAHHDTHCVLALQLAGSKTWRLYDSPVELPLPDQPSLGMALDLADPVELTTYAGDVLYLPRGQVHDAHTGSDEPSLHVTLGINVLTWRDVVASALVAASHDHVELRRGLPADWVDGVVSPPPLPDLTPYLAEAVERLRDDLVVGRQVLADGALLDALTPLDDDAVLEPRTTTMVRRSELGDGRVQLVAAGSRLTLTADEVPVADRLLAPGPTRVGDAGPGALALAGGLVRHGLLQRVR